MKRDSGHYADRLGGIVAPGPRADFTIWLGFGFGRVGKRLAAGTLAQDGKAKPSKQHGLDAGNLGSRYLDRRRQCVWNFRGF